MKILLISFVLFFSSSVVAGDDLTGKKLLCVGDHEEAETLENYSFNFISDESVEVEKTNPLESIKNFWLEYESFPEFIKVIFVEDNVLRIDRKTLILENYNFRIYVSRTIGKCKLIEGNKSELLELLIEEMNNQLKNLKEGNIL